MCSFKSIKKQGGSQEGNWWLSRKIIFSIFVYGGTLTLDGVTMTGGKNAKYGVLVNDENGASLVVTNSTLQLSSESGIKFGGETPSGTVTGSVAITNSTVEGSKYGLELQKGTSATLDKSTIKNSAANGSAIASFGGTSIIIESSTISGVNTALKIQNGDDDGTVPKTTVSVKDSTLWGTFYGVVMEKGDTEISGKNYTLKGDLVVYVSNGTCSINGATIETTDKNSGDPFSNVMLYVRTDGVGAALTLLNMKSSDGKNVYVGQWSNSDRITVYGSKGKYVESSYAFYDLDLEAFSS